jgi:hypothetical protein
MGGRNQEGLLVAAKCNTIEKVGRTQEYLEAS